MSEKICIVDDNLVNRKLLAGILKREGYEFLEAEDGEAAVDLILKELPDLVLLDVMMPKKDGYQVCEELKRDQRSAHIPIIFLSAKTQVEDKIKGLDLGGADYVTKPFDRGEVLARVRTQLNIARLTKEVLEANEELMRKQRRLNEDLEAAAGIQQSLLPQEPPDMEDVAVAWRFMPCESIGGDIFNVVRLDERHWGIYMLDVSGHGVPSALVTVSVSQMLLPHRGLLLKKAMTPPPYYKIRSPAEVLNLLDWEYPIERFNKYFTITYLILDVKEGLIRYSNAAHPPPILVRRDGTLELLEKGGTIIGMGGMLPFEEGEKRVEPGDKLVVYTDGIVEYEDRQGRFYGEERFHGVLKGLRKRPISELIDGVIDALMDYGDHNPPRDDVTLLGFEFRGEAG
ncbi:MAG: phosphoserine phosphatase RsbU/P [Thermodesulfobacteriota bacterium]|nr:phosphoserine phosphatase RsbU/P [Thermodesulfobacteriota bacterium]